MSESLKPLLSFFFVLYQHTALSSRAVEHYQIFSGGLNVGKVSLVGPEISPTPSVIFTVVKKCQIWRRFRHNSTFSGLRLKNSKIFEL